ncbi:aminotransferase class IV [Psychrobacter sp. DAB_AL43B]|uniref:aminotransferase class IV n=1 Tax=Psychrobacter sp. DAB_AL43B TaxID=1028416 RepID=UPI0009A76738|nr:aminotransferase class IV [Psychrobacter sp. DAB_AL43B]SLJ83393.1 aminodeoxychorismate lyase [Psychrobacter sp. DAB_AL43B]
MLPSNSWSCLSHLPQTDKSPDNSTVTASLDNRGLAYADGFFTTMGVINGLILWQDYHYQRLISHAKALHLDLDSRSLLAILQTHAQQLSQGILKLIITRAVQDIRGYGYTPSESGSKCEIWLKSSAMTIATSKQLHLPDCRLIPMQSASTAVCLSSQLACLPPPLAGLKSLNRLDNVLASAELQAIKVHRLASNIELGISEGLLRDMSGPWVEGTMSNVFYQLSNTRLVESESILNVNQHNSNYLRTGQWYTPSMAQSGVAGVMRQVIIDGLAKTDTPVIIKPLTDEDLPQLSQLFFCNALRGIMPMTSLTLLSGEVVSF